jgi:hypothetical protein
MEKEFSYIRSLDVLVMDLEEFFQTLIYLQKQKKSSKVVVWKWHVVHYIRASDDGFPSPLIGLSFNVYVIFCHGCASVETSVRSFKISRGGGHTPMKFKTTCFQTLLHLCCMLRIIQNFIVFFAQL